MGFDALIPALNTGNIDVAIAGMSITDERKQAVGMSDPYYTSGLIVMVKKTITTSRALRTLPANALPHRLALPALTKQTALKMPK